MRLIEVLERGPVGKPLMEDRVGFLIQKYAAPVARRFAADPDGMPDEVRGRIEAAANPGEALVRHFLSIDPSHNKRFTQWLIRLYLQDRFRPEDADRATEALEKFGQIQGQLEIRDIGRYDSLQALEAVTDATEAEPSQRQTDREHDAAMAEQAKVEVENADGKIIKLLTREAACHFGRQTKWCTSAQNNNMFDSYNQHGPIYVLLMRDGRKFQFHYPSRQFMDERDQTVDFEAFMKAYPVMARNKGVVLAALRVRNRDHAGHPLRFNGESYLKLFPNPTEEMIQAALIGDGNVIDLVPNPTFDQQAQAVATTPEVIFRIPDKNNSTLRVYAMKRENSLIPKLKPTEAEQLELVNETKGAAFKFFTDPSPRVIDRALELAPYNLARVKNQTEENILKCLEKDKVGWDVLRSLRQPPSKAVQIALVTNNPHTLKGIPNPCPEAQMIAVRQNPDMISYIENPSVKVTAYAAMKGKFKQYTHKELNDPPDDEGKPGSSRTVNKRTMLGRLTRGY